MIKRIASCMADLFYWLLYLLVGKPDVEGHIKKMPDEYKGRHEGEQAD